MNSSRLLTALLLSTAILFGCGRQEGADSNRDNTMNDGIPAITFQGDFTGPLGLQLWSVRNYASEDLESTLARVSGMGFREVELAGTYGMAAADFVDVLRSAGLRATAMHAPYELFRDSLETVLDGAAALGVEYAGVAWIPHDNNQPFTAEMARTAAADFNAWGKAAKQRGIQFFYHVHGYEYRPDAAGSTPFDVIVAETAADAVTFEMDVFWVTHSGTDPVELLKKYSDRWSLMHVKDMKAGTPTSDYSGSASEEADVPIGTGMIDYPAVLRAAEEIGIARYFVEDESPTPLENIPKSISFLQAVRF
jgi:sugar phosphate isomerase/epimerase